MHPDDGSARQVVEDAVRRWIDGDDRAFWRLLADDVQYDVIGTTPASGHYDSARAFFDGALKPMGALLAQGARPVTYDIVAEGDRVVLMWSGRGVMLSGEPYDNEYCWILDVAGGKVRRVKAYLDTELVARLFTQRPAGG